MTTDLRKIIVEDVRSKFGDDMAERVLNKDLVKSLAEFYQTEDNYRKHSVGIPLNPEQWAAIPDSNAGASPDLLAQIFSSAITNDEHILFVVDNDREAEIARLAIKGISEFLTKNDRTVSVMQKEPTEDIYTSLKKWIKPHGKEDAPVNLVGLGVGYNSSLRDVGYENFGNIKQVFVDSSKIRHQDDENTSICTKFGESRVGFAQVLSTCFTSAVKNALGEDVVNEWGFSGLESQLQELAYCEHQSSVMNAPVSSRTSNLEDLTKYTELQNGYNFQESLGWAIGLKHTLGASGVDGFHKTLVDAGVEPERFNDSITSIFEANVSANVIYELLDLEKSGDLPLDAKGKPLKFADSYSERLLESVPINIQQYSSKNALRSLREMIIDLETKANRTEIETSSLKQLKSLSFKLREAVKSLKDSLRESEAVEFIRDDESSVAICKYRHGIEQYIDDSFLNTIHKKPLDGTLISYPEVPNEASRLHLKVHTSKENRKAMMDASMHFKMGGMDVSQPYAATPNVIQISSNVRGRGVDDDTVRRFAKSVDSIVKRDAERLSKSIDSVIVAEPDSLGEALDLLNYVGAGHSNSVDPNVNLRIPKKLPLRVTMKGTGVQKLMTIDEVMAAGLDDFSTFEVMYTDPDPAKKASPKSLFIDPTLIKDMAKDVGKKRFYGPLRLGYSTNGISGKLHVKGYDPDFSIRYKKDVVLRAKKQRHQTPDKFWADMKKKGNVERSVPEALFKSVNGVDLNKNENFEVFKGSALEVIDRMNGGTPDTTGDAAYWCVDTETTGLSADSDLLNFGAACYSVVPDSGQEVNSAMIVSNLAGEQFLLSESSELEEVHSIEALGQIEPRNVIRVGERGDEKLFEFNPKTLTKVQNVGKIDDERSVINRELQLDYLSALVKADEFSKVPTVIEELSGVSSEQIDKYGIGIEDLESIFTKETERFKAGNAFAIHNAPFDIGVLSRQSKKIKGILTSSNNILVDTRVLAGGDEPLLYNEPDSLYSITSTGSAPVEARFSDKPALIEFLKNAKSGDRLEGEKGAIEISKTGLLTVFATHNSPKGKGCKLFNKEDRTEDALLKIVSESKVLTLPTLGEHKFENRDKLKGFLKRQADGSRFSDIFGNGYITFSEGRLLSVKNGVASSVQAIGSKDDDLESKIGTHHLNKTTTRTNMEALMGHQKVIDLIKTTMEISRPSQDELFSFLPDGNKEELLDLVTFANGYDLSKSEARNVSDFIKATSSNVSEAVLSNVSKALCEKNKEISYAYSNKSAVLRALRELDKVKTLTSKEFVVGVADKVGVDVNSAVLAANMLNRAKKGRASSLVFKEQSHCNAERYNSDVMTELMVATNIASNRLGNAYSKELSTDNVTNALAKAAVSATVAGEAQVASIDVATVSSAPIFTGERKHSSVRDVSHGLKRTVSIGSSYDKTGVDIESNTFDCFASPDAYKCLFDDLPLVVASKKIEAGMYNKRTSGFVDKALDAGAIDVAMSAEGRLDRMGISVNGVGLRDEYTSKVGAITDAIISKALKHEVISDDLFTPVQKSEVFELKRDVMARLHSTSGAAKLLGNEHYEGFRDALSGSTKVLSELTDASSSLYSSLKDNDSEKIVADGNNLSTREQSLLADAVFKTPYVREKLELLNNEEINSIRDNMNINNKDLQVSARRMTL